MASIKVKKIERLEHTLETNLPKAELNELIEQEFTRLAKTQDIKGYRKGKVPVSAIKQHYGNSVKQSMLEHLMEKYFVLSLKEKDLHAASPAQYEVINDEGDDTIRFSARFEVFPTIKLPKMSKLSITKPVCQLDDAATERMINKLREQQASWEKEDRAAKEGDRLLMDYVGKLNDEPFDGGTAEGAHLTLGAKQFIEGFEEGLIGVKAGEARSLNLTFPKAYHAEKLAGQAVVFDVTVHEVQAQILPEANEAFVKQLGIESGDIADLTKELESTMQRESTKAVTMKAKQAVFDALSEKCDFDLPHAMVDREIASLQQEMMRRFEQQGMKPNQLPELPREHFEDQANKRVKLGLIMSELVQENKMEPSEAQVLAKIDEIAVQYQDGEQVKQWYHSHPEEMDKLKSVVVEDMAIEWVLEQAKVTEENVDYETLMQQS